METSLQHFRKSFVENFPDAQEADTFFFMLLEAYAELTKAKFFAEPDRELSDEIVQRFNAAKVRLVRHEPIQYILGYEWFYGRKFYVNPHVLIPRPETEELVDWIVEEYQNRDNLKVIDLCTGSGCIAISLALSLKGTVSAVDISAEALAVAEKSAQYLDAATNFILTDVLGTDLPKDLFDVIVSNPPYVREAEKDEMQANVLDYEPHLALFVTNDDPLLFYRRILEYAQKSLKPEGSLYFEINQYLEKPMRELAVQYNFYGLTTRTDFRGNVRMLKLTRT